jgi:uroporphyrinogen decarboxylase
MTPIERVNAVLARQRPDRPPFSFWHHFESKQAAGTAALQAHLDLLEKFDLDFLKVMNDNPYPHPGRIESVEDLASLADLRGDEAGFGEQLSLLESLRTKVAGRVYLATTLFNAWAVLRRLISPPATHGPPNLGGAPDGPSEWIKKAYAGHPEQVIQALRTIGANLARFAALCVRAGADGIYLSVRDDWVDTPDILQKGTSLYADIVRPTDLAILQAVQGARLNILHVCGRSVNFGAFSQYPIPVINWADRAAGPTITAVKDWLQPAICAGVDNLATLPNGSPQDVEREVADTLRQAGARPMMIAPGCTFDPNRVLLANLQALGRTVRRAVYHEPV